MKSFIITVAFLFFSLGLFAQGKAQRAIMYHTYADNGIILALNSGYYLIEDSCAQIVRYAHYDFTERIFTGSFKDVSKLDTNVVVSEGSYNADGKRDGPFTARYLNGNMRAKGTFKANAYDGKWQIFYEDGKPDINFEVTDGQYNITDAWKPDGTKMVDNGNGTFMNDMTAVYWKGKIVNGKPDGTWKLTNVESGNSLFTEHFKKGVFQDGANQSGTYNYTDKSHIMFVSPFKMPLTNVENMSLSPEPCYGNGIKKIVSAKHKYGSRALTDEINELINPYLSKVELKGIDNTFVIEGEISTAGRFTNMFGSQGFREDLSRGIISRLKDMSDISPATVDGKPVVQKFSITFVFASQLYQYSYKFYPIDVK